MLPCGRLPFLLMYVSNPRILSLVDTFFITYCGNFISPDGFPLHLLLTFIFPLTVIPSSRHTPPRTCHHINPSHSFQVLKSRLQSAPTGTYSGILDCARKTIAADGIGALWKGFGPAMARAFPANAATFVSLDSFASLAIIAIMTDSNDNIFVARC